LPFGNVTATKLMPGLDDHKTLAEYYQLLPDIRRQQRISYNIIYEAKEYACEVGQTASLEIN
jgi:hypothetical protein